MHCFLIVAVSLGLFWDLIFKTIILVCLALISFSLVQFSSVSGVSDSLRPHESQHARPSCPSPTPGVHSDSHPSSQWCHPAISSSVVPFSYCPQSLPTSESFPMSQLFASDGQSTGVSALASFLPKNTQDWSPLEWTGLVYLILHHIDILTIVFLGNNFKFTFCKNRNHTYICIYSTQIHLLIFYSIYFITYIGDFSYI